MDKKELCADNRRTGLRQLRAHCPVGAITMVPLYPEAQEEEHKDEKKASLKIPVVNEEMCIGCGACENLCPSRPFPAIYVEGHEVHRRR